MPIRNSAMLLVLLCTLAALPARGDDELLNRIDWTDRITSSGQPSRDQLGQLGEDGFVAVINLAPPQSQGSIADEGGIVARDGMLYVNIPVDWERPTVADFRFFADALKATAERRTLVHCQINMRASAFTFLYRVVHDGEDPYEAWDLVTRVWVPDDQWRELVDAVLAEAGIAFEP